MSLYFSICAPSGKFLCADALLGRHIHKVQRRLTTAGMVLG